MKGNIVLAAAVFAAGINIASIILVLGVQSALNDAMLRLDASVKTHAKSVEQAGAAAGVPIGKALVRLTNAVGKHAGAIEHAGENISRPQVTIKGPVDIAQPVRIEGPRKDGSLPVNARLDIAQPLRIEGPRKDGSLPVNARLAK